MRTFPSCFNNGKKGLSLINVNLVTKPGTLSGLCSQDWLCFSSCISISHGSQSALSRCYSAWYAANTENCCCSVVRPLGYWKYDSMSSQSKGFFFCLLALSSNNLPFTFLATSKVLIVQFLNSSALLILSTQFSKLPGSSMSSPSTWRCTRKWKNCSSLVSALSWHQSFFPTIVAPTD